MSDPTTPVVRPLLVSSDDDLVDEVLQVAARAGVGVTVVPEAGAALACWADAALVLVGDDQCAAVARAGLPRRGGLVVVGRDLHDPGVWRRAVAVGADHVVFLPQARDWLALRLAGATGSDGTGSQGMGSQGTGSQGTGSDGGAVVVACVGGCGGAGATTVAVALSRAGLRAAMSTLLLDADPLGGGIGPAVQERDLLLRGQPPAACPAPVSPSFEVGARAPHPVGLTVLAWDRPDLHDIPPEAMAAVLADATPRADLIVADLPRRADRASQVVLCQAHRVFLVVPARPRAVAAARSVAAALRPLTEGLRVLVRGGGQGGPAPGAVAKSVGLPLAGWWDAAPGLPVAVTALPDGDGDAEDPLAALSDRLIRLLPQRVADRPG